MYRFSHADTRTLLFLHVSVAQLLSHVRLFAIPQTAALQAFLSFTISWSSLRSMFIESVMPSNHLILCCPLLLLPSVFLSIRVFSNESALHIRWPKYWSFSLSISPSNEYSGLTYFRSDSFLYLCKHKYVSNCNKPLIMILQMQFSFE